MSTPRSVFLATVLAGLFGGLLTVPTSAQQTHGSITTVSGTTLSVTLDDSIGVEPGTVGRVVEERRVGGDPVQMAFAVVTVQRVERSFDGAWTVICAVDRQSEDLKVDDRILFESVFARPQLALRTTPPGATVYLDSVEVGTTPVEGPVGVGNHEVRLEREGYYSERRSFTAEPGDQLTVWDSLETARGTVVVETRPDGATVELGDRSLGPTPVTDTMPAGTYEVRVTREGYLPEARTMTVAAGAEKRLALDLRRPLEIALAEQQPDAIVNPRLSREDDRLIVQYDLVGDADAYRVQLELSTNGGRTYEPLPESVAGAAGDEIAPGRDQQIVWSALEDFPDGFSGSGNRLRLAVEPAGGNSLYWVVGSALAAGASATAAAVLGVFGSGGGGGSSGGDLPDAPPPAPN